METGVKEGMCVMENVVLELYQQKKITKETALINVTTRNVRQKIEPAAVPTPAAPAAASAN
jgi:twitching motility protein PilT